MATEASFTVPATEIPLSGFFESFPDARIELERLVPMRGGIAPYVWMRGMEGSPADLDLHGHAPVEDMQVVDTVEDNWLLRVVWSPEQTGLFRTLVEMDLPVVNVVGTSRHWRIDVRGETRAEIATLQERCRERQIPIEVTSVQRTPSTETGLDSVPTDAQRRAIALAHRRGYFEFPRDVTMEELGAELDISQQAFANRLWRGIDQLLDDVLKES